MMEFFVFLLSVFSVVWGTMILASYLKRKEDTLEQGDVPPELEGLVEENRRLEARVSMIEDELRFVRELLEPREGSKLLEDE